MLKLPKMLKKIKKKKYNNTVGMVWRNQVSENVTGNPLKRSPKQNKQTTFALVCPASVNQILHVTK